MNEPVAWIRQGKYGKPIIVQNPCYQFSYQAECAKWDDIPLYTHPAKTQADIEYEADKAYWRNRTLTDEEIKEVLACLEMAHDETMDYIKINNLGGENNHWLVWARAILRKAQEK